MSLKLFGLGMLLAVGAAGKTYTYSYTSAVFDMCGSLNGPCGAGGTIDGSITLSRPLGPNETVTDQSSLVIDWNLAGYTGPEPDNSFAVTTDIRSRIFDYSLSSFYEYAMYPYFGNTRAYASNGLNSIQVNETYDDQMFPRETSYVDYGYNGGTWTQDFTLTPEPGLYAALGIGLAGLAAYRRATPTGKLAE